MSNERYILLIETRQEASPHNITILKNQVISLQSLFYHLGKLLKGLPKATSDNRRPYLRALFGDNIFSYEGVDLFNELSYVSPTDNASVFVKQSFIGHMSDKVAVIPVLNMFVSVLNQKTIIQQTYVHLENIYKDYPIDELKQVVEEIKPLIGLWKEKIKAYNNSNILFPYENAINILERIDELSKHIEDGKSVCRIITGLGYFAICFLSLTKKSYDYYYTDTVNVSEGEIITFKTVQVALPELLKSIKVFLDDSEPLSQAADESHDSLQSNERRIQQEAILKDKDVDSDDFDDLILKLTLLSQANYAPEKKRAERAKIISKFVDDHFKSIQISDDEVVKWYSQTLGIDNSDKYTSIRMMLKKCSVALKVTSDLRVDDDVVRDCDYTYNAYLSRAKMLKQTIANDYEPEK